VSLDLKRPWLSHIEETYHLHVPGSRDLLFMEKIKGLSTFE
jgi:hypothetical protein